MIIARRFVFKFDVIRKVDRIVDRNAEYHRHNRHREHIERISEKAHESADEQYRGGVRDHADKSRMDARKHDYQKE